MAQGRLRLLAHVYDSVAGIHMTKNRADMASREPKEALINLWGQACMIHIEHVGQQRVNSGCSTGLTGLQGTRAVAARQDSGTQCVTFPRRDRHRNKVKHMPASQVSRTVMLG